MRQAQGKVRLPASPTAKSPAPIECLPPLPPGGSPERGKETQRRARDDTAPAVVRGHKNGGCQQVMRTRENDYDT